LGPFVFDLSKNDELELNIMLFEVIMKWILWFLLFDVIDFDFFFETIVSRWSTKTQS